MSLHQRAPLTGDAPRDSFIIETCHAAAGSAAYSHRAKIKVDDFKFALRRDRKKLGRVTELLALDRDIKKKRKAFEVEDEVVVKEGRRGKGDREKDREKDKERHREKDKERDKEKDKDKDNEPDGVPSGSR